MKKSLIQKLGLLGFLSFLSYAAAVFFSPLAYPGYNPLAVIVVAGAKNEECRSYGICAAVALAMMLVGALGMKIVPAAYFGVVERFSVFAVTGFNAALGFHLFCTKPDKEPNLNKRKNNNDGK